MLSKKHKTVEEYLSTVPEDVKEALQQLRTIIRQTAPKAKEEISYNMPAYRQHGVLVYFAACKNHIGFYPTSSPIRVFKKELAAYQTSKGAIQFPLDKKLPVQLIKQIVKFRIQEDAERAKTKKKS